MIEQVNPGSQGNEISFGFAFALIFLSAVSGEAYRGDKDNLRGGPLVARIVFRAGAAVSLALSTFWLAIASGSSITAAVAWGGLVAVLGADAVLALYLSLARKRLGIDSKSEDK